MEALIKNGYNVVAVVTNPDEPFGRKNILTPPPVKVLAQKHKILVLQPENLKDPNFKKELPEADLFIVAAYGKLIPKEILDMPKYGALNIHPSLLPRWRGPSPIQSTILAGDKETGVTIIKMDELMDHGPILAKRELVIFNSQFSIPKTTYQKLHDTLAKLGAELLMETLPRWLKGEITLVPQDNSPQDNSKTTHSKILKKDDGRINWSRPAEEVERMIRAFNPWPGAWTLWPSDKKIYRLRIEKAVVTDDEPVEGGPGYTYRSPYCSLLVKTGKGSLIVEELTLGGKKRTASAVFLRGYPNFLGSRLI